MVKVMFRHSSVHVGGQETLLAKKIALHKYRVCSTPLLVVEAPCPLPSSSSCCLRSIVVVVGLGHLRYDVIAAFLSARFLVLEKFLIPHIRKSL